MGRGLGLTTVESRRRSDLVANFHFADRSLSGGRIVLVAFNTAFLVSLPFLCSVSHGLVMMLA